MSRLGRVGFSLVELLVALVLFGAVTAGIYRVLVDNQRLYRAQTQRIDLQQNIRAAVTILPAEFRELDATNGDIKAMSATSITIRAMRQLGFICSPPILGGSLSGVPFTIRSSLFFGTRGFNTATDSVLIYYEGDPATRGDDSWVLGALTGVGTANCPDGEPGQQLTTNLALAASQPNQAGAVPGGAPVRGFETVTYLLYQSGDGDWYLGLRNDGGTQPLIGPVRDGGGLTFSYYDAAGAVTTVPAEVALIEIELVGQTAEPIRQADGSLGFKVDSIVTQVALRNNQRF